MSDYRFENSVQLFKILRELKLPSGQSLDNELKCGSQVSLWDVVAPYLVLYRFPLLWSEELKHSLKQRLLLHLWPYRGLAAQLKNTMAKRPRFINATCDHWSTDGSTVLLLGFHNLFYREVLQPVAEWLAKNTELRMVILGQQSLNKEDYVTINNQTFQSIWGYWDRSVAKRTKEMLTKLRVFQNSILNQIKFTEIIRRANIDVDLLALHREFKWFFWRECRRLIPQIAIAEHILMEHRPTLIVSADDADQRCRIYSLMGQRLGIPSLLVQQGLTSGTYPEWALFSGSAVAAMGQTSQEIMVAQGVPPGGITVTGHPGFDRLILREPDACDSLRESLGVTSGQNMVLFASQPHYVGVFNTPEIRRVMIRAIVRVATSLENIRLVVKPHPSEDVRELKGLLGTNSRIVIIDKISSISLLVKACDVLITFFSTVALQALYAGKPVINVAYPESGGNTLYSESGATWTARSLEEIQTQLNNLTGKNKEEEIAKRDAARRRFVYQWAHLQDGLASERVAHLVLALLRQVSIR